VRQPAAAESRSLRTDAWHSASRVSQSGRKIPLQLEVKVRREAAQRKIEQTAGLGVLGSNQHTMKPPEEESQMQDALAALALDKPGLLHSFMEVFSERSQFPELPESRGQEGLTKVLSRLLWTYVPDSYFERDFCDATGTAASPDGISKLSSALAGVARKHPFVIDDFRRLREDRKITVQSALEACFRFYVDNRTVFPG